MPDSRLTGLEFYWFGKGQLLATRYQYGESMNLDALTAALAASVSEDAKESFAGAESLRRVAARFVRDADGVGTLAHEPAPLPFDRVHADRRTRALRGLLQASRARQPRWQLGSGEGGRGRVRAPRRTILSSDRRGPSREHGRKSLRAAALTAADPLLPHTGTGGASPRGAVERCRNRSSSLDLSRCSNGYQIATKLQPLLAGLRCTPALSAADNLGEGSYANAGQCGEDSIPQVYLRY